MNIVQNSYDWLNEGSGLGRDLKLIVAHAKTYTNMKSLEFQGPLGPFKNLPTVGPSLLCLHEGQGAIWEGGNLNLLIQLTNFALYGIKFQLEIPKVAKGDNQTLLGR